jgi:signal transduction histidine kinase
LLSIWDSAASAEPASRAEGSHDGPALRALLAVAHAVACHLDLSFLLPAAVRELEGAFPRQPCVFWLVEDGPAYIEYDIADGPAGTSVLQRRPAPPSPVGSVRFKLEAVSAGEGAESLGLVRDLRLPLPETPFAACWQEGRALHLDWTSADARDNPLAQSLAQRGATSCRVLPLRAGTRTLGILQCVCLGAAGFSAEQEHLLDSAAHLLGPAIGKCQHHARLQAAYLELSQPPDQRIQAEKMRALGEMAGGMAHGFNNALCGILGFVELVLLDQSLRDTSRGFLESARTCVFDAIETVRRVQAFARRRRYDLSVQILDLNEVVRQTLELIRPGWESQVPGAAIQLDVRTEATTWVRGRTGELREALTNLAANAVEAMPQGGTLTIQTWSTPEHVFLAVADTGRGMTKEVRRRLFEPFFTTHSDHGHGLGLGVVYGVVQRHGGEITVTTEPDRGSRFVVRLPAAGDDSSAAGPGPAESASVLLPSAGGPR